MSASAPHVSHPPDDSDGPERRETAGGETVGHGPIPPELESPPELELPPELESRLRSQPREVGVLLVTIGVLGLALPGLAGTPALLAGGLMLWPRGFRSVDGWLSRRWPRLHRHGMEQLIRYLDDMERRYPIRR